MFVVVWILLTLSRAEAVVLSVTVGRVNNHIVTSREVLLHNFVGRVAEHLDSGKPLATATKSSEFQKQASETMMDLAISSEAEALQAIVLSPKEIAETVAAVDRALKTNEQLRGYGFSDKEIRTSVVSKLESQKFMAFKTDSSAIPVSDTEVRAYYDKNRDRFGDMPFENFRETIRNYLIKTQVENRVREWLDLLQTKYRIKNFSA
jgi:hypothetical protein